MDNNLKKTLEKRFSDVGWKVIAKRENGSPCQADMALLSDEKILGFVEVIDNASPERFVGKVETIRKTISLKNTPLFIITDGTIFYVSIFGAKFEATTMVPGPQGYFALKASILDYVAYVNQEGSNND